MRFAEPYLIYFLFIILALGVFLWQSFRLRRRALEKFAQKELLGELLGKVSLSKQKIKTALLFMAVVLIFFALLGPQWGFQWQEVKRKGLDIVIALDASKSMLTQDVLPNRFARAKLAIHDFTRSIKGDRIALLPFAGSAFLECPLTLDYGGFLLSLDSLDTNTIPRGGTSISGAIHEALKSFVKEEKKYKVLVLITDGEDHEGDALKAAQQAKDEGVVIYCIGIGTKEGDLIPAQEEAGQGYLKDKEGNVVKSRLDEELLEKIALATGGSYVRSTSGEFGLELLYRDKLSKLEKKELEGRMNKRYEDRFQLPLAVALVLLLAELLISDKK